MKSYLETSIKETGFDVLYLPKNSTFMLKPLDDIISINHMYLIYHKVG